MPCLPLSAGLDYSVVIVAAVFLFASLSWVLSAHKWFHGPIRTVEGDNSEKRKPSSPSTSVYDEKRS